MGIGDAMKKMIGIDDEYEEITDEEVNEAKKEIEKETARRSSERTEKAESNMKTIQPKAPAPSAPSSYKQEHRRSVTSTSAFRLLLIEPSSFEECPKLVDSLKARRPVIINLESLETDVARKIFDFLSGATYALNGNVQKVANNIFIFAPENVDIAGGQQSSAFDYTSSGLGTSKKDDSNPWG